MRGMFEFFLFLAASNSIAMANGFGQNPGSEFHDFEVFEQGDCEYRASDFRLDLGGNWKRIWFLAQGSFLDNVDEQNEISDFNAYSYAFSIGTDRRWNNNIFYGYGITGNRTRMDSKGVSEGATKTILLNGHIRINLLKLNLDLDTGVGFGDNTRDRNDRLGLYRSDYNSLQWHGAAELAWTMEQGFAKFQPFLNFRYGGLKESSFNGKTLFGSDRTRPHENNSGITGVSTLGMRYFWSKEGQYAVITPNISAGWVHEFEDTTIFTSNEFSNAPIFYRYMDAHKPRDRAYIGGGFTASMRKCMDVYLRYNAELADNYGSHGIVLGMNWNF